MPRQSSPSQNRFSSTSNFRSTAREARLSSSFWSSAEKSGIRLSSSILFTVSHVIRTYNQNRAMRFCTFLLLCAAALPAADQPKSQSDFYPFAVWYGGGKARAPMLERDPKSKREVWRKDLKAI